MNENERRFKLYENGEDLTTPKFREHLGNLEGVLATIATFGERLHQAYLREEKYSEVDEYLEVQHAFPVVERRVRRKENEFIYTAKGPGTSTRPEEEMPLNAQQFQRLYRLCDTAITQIRYGLMIEGRKLEVKKYGEHNLVLAEFEVAREDQLWNVPLVGIEVTEDEAYNGRNLAIPIFSK